LHSKTFSYVPNSAIKDVLTQPDSEGRRGKWIAKIHAYELEIKPTKMVKGKGLAKLMDESNYQVLYLNLMTTNIMATRKREDEAQEQVPRVSLKFSKSDWYKDIIFYLQHLSCSPLWEKDKARSINLKAVK